MAPTATVTRHQEVTLKVEAPQLNDTATSTIKTAILEGSSFWTVSLTRSKATLNVSANWSRQQHVDLPNYTMMHIIPHTKNSSILEKTNSITALMQGNPAQCVIDIDKVIDDGMYRFDIVFSTHKEMRKLASPSLKSREILPLLLKDPNTVDVCFTFSSDKAHSHIGLWAHRVVLSRYKVFAKMIEKEDAHQRLMPKANSDKDKDKDKATTTIKAESDVESTRTISDDTPSAAPSIDSRAIMIKVDKFPLATFCALLYYIYMDEIDLSVDTSRFVISVSEGGSLVWRDSDGKVREHHPSICWPPLDQGSSWKLKDVAWDELLEAADFYDVSELRSYCLTGALNGLNEQNAVRFVFSCDAEVKRMAMRYIVDRAEEFFEKGKQDPFLAYKEHPDCHEVLVELMQMKAKKA